MALLAQPRDRRTWRRQLLTASAARRASAATALGAVHGAGAALILGRALLQDQSPFVRRMAAESLGLAGGRAAGGALLRALDEKVAAVLASVLRALGRCGVDSPDAMAAMVDALGHSDPRVCEAALLALWDLQHPDLSTHAVALCVHPEAAVRRAALVICAHASRAEHVLSAAVCDPDPAAAQLAGELLRSLRAV